MCESLYEADYAIMSEPITVVHQLYLERSPDTLSVNPDWLVECSNEKQLVHSDSYLVSRPIVRPTTLPLHSAIDEILTKTRLPPPKAPRLIEGLMQNL